LSIIDRGLNLASMADDRGIAQQSLNISLGEARDFIDIKILKAPPKIVSLIQNRAP
jgi:hypothetical protein